MGCSGERLLISDNNVYGTGRQFFIMGDDWVEFKIQKIYIFSYR